MKKVAILLFITSSFVFAQLPTATVEEPTNVTTTSATLNAKVNIPNSFTSTYSVKVYIYLTNVSTGVTTEYYIKTYTSSFWGGEPSFSKDVTDLSKNTEYYYRSQAAEYNFGTVFSTSEKKYFTTAADTLKVPSAYTTIQAGLNAATSGDVVLVSAGTYTENIMWPDVNGIKLISAGDSSNTIIDGGNTSSVIYLNSTNAVIIDTSALIKGFKIQNGGGGVDYGGGIYIKKSGLKIEKCSIEQNSKGGILIEDSSQVYIYHSSISGNSGTVAALHLRSGIICEVYNSLVTNNSGTYGGGIANGGASLLIKSSTITNNKSSTADAQGGGGLFSNVGTTKIYDSKFSKNESSYGGGITVSNQGNLLLNNVELLYNTATVTGGGLYIYGSASIDSIIMDTVLIFNNNAKHYAGGLGILYAHTIGKFEINNVKIISNTSDASAGLWLSHANDDFSLSGITLAYNKGSTIVGHFTYGSNKYNLSKSSIYNNENTDYAINAMGGSIIDKSNFFGNKRALYNSVGPNMVTAENNYWGDSSGPYHPSQNTSGSGDSTSSIVDVDPWLTTPDTDAPPIPSQNLKLDSQTVTSATFSWDASKMGDIAGYKFYYDTDSSGYPYANSVDLGNVVTKSLVGLTTGKTYYVAVSTYDTDGNESWYSKEVAVQLNNTPVIAAVSDVTINEDESSTVTLSATDADGDAITYSAVSDTSAIDVSVTSSALKLSTLANWNGVANIKAYASDGYSKDSTSFKLTVTAVNDAPIITAVSNDSTNEGTKKSIVLSASDVDGDALTYTASSDTSAMGITVSSDTLKLNPETNYTGTTKITVVVSDDVLKDTTSFNFKVININDSPVISTLSDVTIKEDETGTATLSATDIDGDALTYSAVSDVSAVTVNFSSGTASGTDTVTDIDGNVYTTVSIGNQVWMAENLKVTKYRDGTAIPTGHSNSDWISHSTGASYAIYKDNSSNADTYGYLYNWYAVNDNHNLAPEGWHVPTQDEWKTLIDYLDGDGGKLKETGTTHWESPNAGATNESGFTAIPGGWRHSNAGLDYEYIKMKSAFWSANSVNSQFAKIYDLNYDNTTLRNEEVMKTFGVSIRCVKDGVNATGSSTTLTLTPNANWHGEANIKAYASDGSAKDSTSFKLTVTPVQDVPTAFEWVSSALDTINITQSNLADTYTLQWDASTDVDGDSITYLLYAGTGASPKEEVYDTTSTSLPIPYQELLQKTFEQIPMLSRATVKFSVSATDGIDTVKVTGDDRVVFVNRYDYLSTESEGIPTEFALHENYPNPFNPTTTLRFDLPKVSDITLTIYNMLGQKVRTFDYQNTSAGYHSVTWDATNDLGQQVGAGVYLYQLQTKDFVKTRKMVLLK
jgi:uncharacterized protein (TIGR02145 family)